MKNVRSDTSQRVAEVGTTTASATSSKNIIMGEYKEKELPKGTPAPPPPPPYKTK